MSFLAFRAVCVSGRIGNHDCNSPQKRVFLHSRGTLSMPNSFDADHHERFRAVRDI